MIDLNGIDPGYDWDLLAALPVHSIRRSGDLRSAFLVLMQRGLTVFNTAATFDVDWYLNRARGLDLERNLKILPQERRFSITMLP